MSDLGRPALGELVVMPQEPALGVGRLERILVADGTAPLRGRVLLYEDGKFVVRPLDAISPCPPGVWNKGGAQGAGAD